MRRDLCASEWRYREPSRDRSVAQIALKDSLSKQHGHATCDKAAAPTVESGWLRVMCSELSGRRVQRRYSIPNKMKNNQNLVIVGEAVTLVPYRREHVPKYHTWMQVCPCYAARTLLGSLSDFQ